MSDEYGRYRAQQAARYMEHIRSLGSRIRMLQSEVDAQRELMESVRGIDYAGMGGSGSPTADAIPDAVIRLQGLVSDYCTELAGYMGERKAAHEALCRLARPEQAEALAAHYLRGESWEEVCVSMHYTWQGMMSLRGRALAALWDEMPHEWRDPRHLAV